MKQSDQNYNETAAATSNTVGEGLPSAPQNKWWFVPELVAITLLAAAFRFYMLDWADLWMDEIRIYQDALNGTNLVVSNAHRVHLTVLGWLLNTFGATPWMLRSWGALLGTLAVPVLYAVGYLASGKRCARLVGVLACFSPFLILYARDANYYGPMTFFASVQLLCIGLYLYKHRISAVVILLLTALTSHYNHPFASILSAFSIFALGVLGAVELWQHRGKLKTFFAPRYAAATVVFLALGGGVLFVLLGKFSESLEVLKSKITFGEGLANVSPNVEFFLGLNGSMLGTNCQPLGTTTFINLVSLYPFALAVVGCIFSVLILIRSFGKVDSAENGQRELGPAYYPTVLLCIFLASLFSALFVIFNVSYRNFNVRYFTFLVPPAFFFVAYGLNSIVETKKSSSTLAAALIAPLIGVYCWMSLPYYSTETANYKELTQILETETTDDSVILFPVGEDLAQAEFYFSPKLLDQTDVFQIRPQNDRAAASWLPYYLYGKPEVLLASGWRHRPLVHFWPLLDQYFEIRYEGFSLQSLKQNAVIYRSAFDDRALLSNVATRFTLSPEKPTLLATKGSWELRGNDELVNQLVAKGSTGKPFVYQSETVQKITLSTSTEQQLTAIPVLPKQLDYGPYGHFNFINDTRNKEAYVEDAKVQFPEEGVLEMPGVPVYEMKFNGVFNYLIYQPENEPRHLVLKRFCPKIEKDKSHLKSPFIYEVAVNGEHVGFFESVDKPGEIVTTEVDLSLLPGNNQVSVYATRLRISDPFHTWTWAGLEWNEGKAKSPATPLPASAFIAPFSNGPVPWGTPGSTELNPELVSSERSYNRIVSATEVGPSGLPALEFTFDGTYENPSTAYTITFGRPIPAKPNQLFAYSTRIKNDRATNYVASLMTAFVDTQGNVIGTVQGKQQHAAFPLTLGWSRFIELGVVPPNCAFIVPGIYVYPPDTNKVAQKGRILVDAFVPVDPSIGPFTPAYLSPKLFFDVANSSAQPRGEE